MEDLIESVSPSDGKILPLRFAKRIEYNEAAVGSRWIEVDGEDIPAPISNFKDMRFPEPFIKKLAEKGIVQPTAIQAQAVPVILSGRDIIGMAPRGCGKTLALVLPLIMMAFQEEYMMPGEGPLGLVICPSPELAKQTYHLVEEFVECTRLEYYNDNNKYYPVIRSMLCTGGVDMRSQSEILINTSVHIVVATPGRLKDMLSKKLMNLDNCRYLVLDEASRIMGSGFQDEIQQVIDCFRDQRQTILFSSAPTVPRNFQNFALVKPVIVNVAASLDVVQEVEYVKQEEKFLCLLQALKKTRPPVLVFSESKADVDEIHEYLIFRGVEAVSIHGGKENEERQHAISSFKAGRKVVLVATDVVSKGLNFPDIRHVINFDMPDQIEKYIRRIAMTGKTGISTTFINSRQSETTLLDLKHVLIDTKQEVPPVLAELSDHKTESVAFGNASQFKDRANGDGLGHWIQRLFKLCWTWSPYSKVS